MSTRKVQYEIQNMDKELVEIGYVIVETLDDDEPEIFTDYEPKNTYAGEFADIKTYICFHCIFRVHRWARFMADIGKYVFLHAIRYHLGGEKYEYEDGDYKIIIN